MFIENTFIVDDDRSWLGFFVKDSSGNLWKNFCCCGASQPRSLRVIFWRPTSRCAKVCLTSSTNFTQLSKITWPEQKWIYVFCVFCVFYVFCLFFLSVCSICDLCVICMWFVCALCVICVMCEWSVCLRGLFGLCV